MYLLSIVAPTTSLVGTDAPICQDTPSGGLDDLLTSAEVGHDALVDLSREEAFQAADDVAFGPASGEASGDVVAGRLVELHPDDDGAIEGRVGVSVAASIEAVPTGGHPRRGRDRAGAAGCFRNQLLLLRSYLVLTKTLSHDIQRQRCVSVNISCKYLDN